MEIDPNKIRPVDVPIIEADITKLNAATGWKPQIPLEQTIQEILEHPKQAWTKEYAAANHPVSREGWTWTD